MSALDDRIWTSEPPKESGYYLIFQPCDTDGQTPAYFCVGRGAVTANTAARIIVWGSASLASQWQRSIHTIPSAEELAQLRAKAAMAEKLERALRPLGVIADRYFESRLDEHRPEWGVREPHLIELLSGRGGEELLNLQQCVEARAVLAEMEHQ